MKTKTYSKPTCAFPEAWLEQLLCSSDITNGSTETYDDLTEYEW